MRRKRGWEREREGEGGRENLRLDGVSPALALTLRPSRETTMISFGLRPSEASAAPRVISVPFEIEFGFLVFRAPAK